MPELPEVETVRRQLAGALTGKTFLSVDEVEPSMLVDHSAAQMRSELPGRRIESVSRLGKFLLVTLDADVCLTFHLGMTGQLLVDPQEAGSYSRFSFELADGNDSRTRLEFRDIRKFGRVHLTTGAPPARLQRLGPDAWQGCWDAAYLEQRLRGRKTALKAFLLDQRHLAGIGNIYADEILWWTGLSPVRPSGSLGAEEVAALTDEIRRRLSEGVRLLGCSLSDFVDTAGKQGGFQGSLQAYGRQGRSCGRCGGVLVRTVVAGRGTTYCPSCQQ